ncbi:hypothetical protein [Corynebacterium pacaense]|nr:hypothetical protein [Corynebacterium pacaense]
MSVVGTGQFFGSPEEEREKLLRELMEQKQSRGDGDSDGGAEGEAE